MKRADAIRTTTLIALPFLLLPVAFWLGLTAATQLPASDMWWVVRWSLRAIFIGGAYLGLASRTSPLVLSLVGLCCLRSRRNAFAVGYSHLRRPCIHGLRSCNSLLGYCALSTRFRPLLCSRALGWLAAFAKASGGLYRLSPRRADHSTLSICGRWSDAKCNNVGIASGRCRCRIVRRPVLACAIDCLGKTREWGARGGAVWRRNSFPTLQSDRHSLQSDRHRHRRSRQHNRNSLLDPGYRSGMADPQRPSAVGSADPVADPSATG